MRQFYVYFHVVNIRSHPGVLNISGAVGHAACFNIHC